MSSNSLQNKTSSKLSTIKVMKPSKKYVIITPTISNSRLVQVKAATSVTVSASTSETASTSVSTPISATSKTRFLAIKKSVPNKLPNHLDKAGGDNCFADNRRYQLVMPSNQVTDLVNGNIRCNKSPSASKIQVCKIH